MMKRLIMALVLFTLFSAVPCSQRTHGIRLEPFVVKTEPVLRQPAKEIPRQIPYLGRTVLF